jgi:hypothetical protein
MASHNTIIFASFDAKDFSDPELNNLGNPITNIQYTNMPSTSIVLTISSTNIQNTDGIQFTTNGIDGFGTPFTVFQIPEINFTNQNIYFTAKIKSASGAPRKNYKKLDKNVDIFESIVTRNNGSNISVSEGDTTLQLIRIDGGVLDAQFEIDYGDLQNDDGGGYLKGYVRTTQPGERLRIRIIHKNENINISLSGVSTFFNILPGKGIYDIRKINEDHNQAQLFKDLRYQETLIDNNNFFDNFLGQIVGDSKSSPNNLGIKIYEKTTNFVSNIADPDISNLKSLVSQLKQLNIPFEEYNQQFPPSLSRLIDILSVGISRQKGASNQFQLNFNNKGYTNQTVFGVNRGQLLPIETTLLRIDIGQNKQSKNIIALEKFSNEYSLVNTNIISASNVIFRDDGSYPLSSYNDTWGWGLVLPNDNFKLQNYYEFYDFVDTVEGSILQKFIDFDNPLNTYISTLTSMDDYIKKWGIADNVISHNLYTNLGLISGL